MPTRTAISLVKEFVNFLSGLMSRPKLIHLVLLIRPRYRDHYCNALLNSVKAEARRNEAIAEKQELANLAMFADIVQQSFAEQPEFRRELVLARIYPMLQNQKRLSRDQRLRDR